MLSKEEILANFSKNVKKYRVAKGVSQETAYEECNVHIGRIEQGNQNVSLVTLVRVAEYLEESVEDLLK